MGAQIGRWYKYMTFNPPWMWTGVYTKVFIQKASGKIQQAEHKNVYSWEWTNITAGHRYPTEITSTRLPFLPLTHFAFFLNGKPLLIWEKQTEMKNETKSLTTFTPAGKYPDYVWQLKPRAREMMVSVTT